MSVLPPTPEYISQAALALSRGELVVIPTETVYGLAADATNEAAVRKIFDAKGRPADNPLIVHIGSPSELEDIAIRIPEYVHKLVAAFWPGPLTLVLPKTPKVIDLVTAGLDSVAVRMPSHPIALEIIREAGIPISAPSANPFMSISPTRVEHIDETIAGAAAMIIDGGPCQIGLESTIVDCRSEMPKVLRPGGISRQQLSSLLNAEVEMGTGTEKVSPGRYPRHYAPRARVILVDRLDADQPGLTFSVASHAAQIQMPRDPVAYGIVLFQALHELDRMELPEFFVERPPRLTEWEAIWDRLEKAAHP
ncbi:MAG TPA: L-threonylcarbamoyladenylate synthase [Fimbriimonadaceae bacterium]|nr:L-threonylcarbamoyladenylate synthase [Fimbriimonadaceae bacterium]